VRYLELLSTFQNLTALQTKFFLLLLLAFIISCKSDEKTRLIYSHSDNECKISVSTIDTKINSDGVAQCSNYAHSTISDSLYRSYGLGLKSVLASSQKTSIKNIGELPIDSLNEKYLKIRIENLTDKKLNFDSILSKVISKAFNFNIISKDSVVSGYKLVVHDIEKLKAHQTEFNGGKIISEDGVWNFSNVKLIALSKLIDQNSQAYISFEPPNENYYSFSLSIGNDYKKNNKELEQIGLKLKKSDFKQTFYKIEVKT